MKKFGYAYRRTKKKGSLIGQMFKTKKEAEKYSEIYKKKGWNGGIVKLKLPPAPTEQERKDLADLSNFLKQMTGRKK